ncbi:MAG: GPP34 family phosphoprotein [Planctomycetota bacterium]|nr:GPP34 family phosphoprotein [Planctomycetota bacterium]
MALLLIVKDEQGTISVSLWDLVLAGAVLCDLVLEERLAVDVEADTCTVVDERPLDDVLLDGCLKLFLDAKRPIAAKHALHHIGRVKVPGLEGAARLRFADLYHAAAQRLCDRGVLRMVEKKVLWIFRVRVYPEVVPEVERALIQELERVLFTDARDVSPRIAALVTVARHSNMFAKIFGRGRVAACEERIDAIAAGKVDGGVMGAAVTAAQAAAALVVMSTAVMTTVTRR